MRLARVFPRKTKASPDDALAFFGPPPFFVECDEVHIDVTFTADKLIAEKLAEDWVIIYLTYRKNDAIFTAWKA